MNKILFDGYTIYLNKQNGKLQGVGLKKLEKNGMDLKRISDEEIHLFSQEYPFICKLLKENCILQIYKNFTAHYEVSIGHLIKEGPYGEIDAFDVISSCSSLVLKKALLDIEESIKLNMDKKVKILKQNSARLYRFYGSDKYS